METTNCCAINATRIPTPRLLAGWALVMKYFEVTDRQTGKAPVSGQVSLRPDGRKCKRCPAV